jgi:hypothetical protein
MYLLVINTSIKLNASGVLYKSGVGGGNTPKAPRIGITIIRHSTTFKMIFIIFILLYE